VAGSRIRERTPSVKATLLTEQEAATWSKSAGREIERIEGSAEVRTLRGETDGDGVMAASRRS